MTATKAAKPKPAPKPIDRRRLRWSDVQLLGLVDGSEYVRFNGSEYVVDAQPIAAGTKETAAPLVDGEIRLQQPAERVDFGTTTTYNLTRRAWRVSPAAFAAAQTREARRHRSSPKPHRPVDLIGRLPALSGTAPHVFTIAVPEREPVIGATSARVPGGFVEARPPITGVAAIVQRLERSGVSLSLTPSGRLLVIAPNGRITDDLLAVVTRCERLIVSSLTGVDVLCELPHDGTRPPADTMLAVDTPACRAHADGALPANRTEGSAA